MAKRNKLFEFEKCEIRALKRNGKSEREISKALGCSETVICNYLKSSNEYGTRKPIGRPETLLSQFKRRIVREVKKKLRQHQKFWNLSWIILAEQEQSEGI